MFRYFDVLSICLHLIGPVILSIVYTSSTLSASSKSAAFVLATWPVCSAYSS